VSGGIAYDSGASRLINVNETGTHVWDGENWLGTESVAGPSPRLDSQLAYDPARHVIVLFGGREYHPNGGTNGKYLNDTWTWDGRMWNEQAPSLSPDFGFDAANMVWDDANRVLLLFGAIRDQASNQVVSATWQWNGTDWHHVLASTSPPHRFGAAMAFEAERSSVVLFGGFDVSPDRHFNDTWTWDGTTWAERFPAHIPANTPTNNGLPGAFAGALSASAMAYDPAHKVVVLVTTDMGVIKTWTWDGSDWAQLQTPVSPRASQNMSTTYDTHSHRCSWLCSPIRRHPLAHADLSACCDAANRAEKSEYNSRTLRGPATRDYRHVGPADRGLQRFEWWFGCSSRDRCERGRDDERLSQGSPACRMCRFGEHGAFPGVDQDRRR
jgi:hypothetical protein